MFLLAWTVTASSLLTLHAVHADAAPNLELLVLTAANVLATLMRFLLLRLWVFRAGRAHKAPGRIAVGSAAGGLR